MRLGKSWFESGLAIEPIEATIEGAAVDRAVARSRAAELIADARGLLIVGVEDCSIEAVGALLRLAMLCDGEVRYRAGDATANALARVGSVSGTFGEVKDRSDMIVFWMCDPIASHPRHSERFSLEAFGRFVPKGRSGRRVIVVDRAETESTRRADRTIIIPSERELEVLGAIRALVKGVNIDQERSRRRLGACFDALPRFVEEIMKARHGAFFWSEREPESEERVELIQRLVRDLNSGRRFVSMPLGDGSNATGARTAAAWIAGSASSFGSSGGFASRSVLAGTIRDMLGENAGFEVVLAIGDRAIEEVGQALADRPEDRPPRVIAIAPGAARPGRRTAVAMRSNPLGIRESGNVMRPDGVILPARARAASRRNRRTRSLTNLRRSGRSPSNLSDAEPNIAMSEPEFQLVIRGGRVIDPANGIDEVRELSVRAGRIVPGAAHPDAKAIRTIDASGMVVMPGGVDMHSHLVGAKVTLARSFLPRENQAGKERLHSGPGSTRPALSRHGLYHRGRCRDRTPRAQTGHPRIRRGPIDRSRVSGPHGE